MQSFDVAVIGQGYSGLMAAKLAHERGLSTANIEAMFAGGLIMSINELDPAPEAATSGADLVSTLAMENMDAGIRQFNSSATALEQDADGWIVKTEEGNISARHVIVASGARLRKLGIPGEVEYFGRGISECADCDGPIYGGQKTVIIGGGDSAFQEALALSHFADTVTIVMRGDKPRAKASLVAAVASNARISIASNMQVIGIDGDEAGVTGIRVVAEDGERVIACSGVFVFVGLDPSVDFLPSKVKRDAAGAVITLDGGKTELEGLWAIGAVRSGFGGMLSDAELDARRVIEALA